MFATREAGFARIRTVTTIRFWVGRVSGTRYHVTLEGKKTREKKNKVRKTHFTVLSSAPLFSSDSFYVLLSRGK